MRNILAQYPLHVLYLFAYAALLILAGIMILQPFSRKNVRWRALFNFFMLLGLACGLFALGYHALGGFTQERDTGVIVIGIYVLIGMLFAKHVNSRNAALLPLIFMLSSTGFLMLYRLGLSSSRIVSNEFIKQIIFVTLGMILMLFLVKILKLIFLLDVHGDRLELLGVSKFKILQGHVINTLFVQPHFSYHIWLVITMLLLSIPLVFGAGMRVSLGTVQVQPSEFVKITFVIYLTHHLTRYRQKIGAWDEPISRRIGFLIPPLVMLSIPFLGYVLQRDFGPLMLYSLLIISMFFVGTSRLLEVGVLLIIFVTTIVLYNQFFPYINALVPKYASIIIDRINIWQNPWLYTKGEQIVRSLWAMKAAGLWGTGLGLGHPEFFPSEVQHDFIFTLITHELGLAGGVLIILNYVLLCWQGMRIAFATKHDVAWNQEWAWFRLRLALGCTLVLFFQAMINIGGVTNFSLMTGITLPYISYGGTSILVSFLLAGILAFCSLTKNEIR